MFVCNVTVLILGSQMFTCFLRMLSTVLQLEVVTNVTYGIVADYSRRI